jgi:hypothetical protein
LIDQRHSQLPALQGAAATAWAKQGPIRQLYVDADLVVARQDRRSTAAANEAVPQRNSGDLDTRRTGRRSRRTGLVATASLDDSEQQGGT